MPNNAQTTCDPDRIEAFLQQQLSAREQSDFETHLGECRGCRERLEASAASEELWAGVRDSLSAGFLPNDLSDSAADQAEFSHQTILDWLAPTDDARMLGRLDSYEIMGVVGSGGMGVVLKALDPALNRNVAIKVLAPHLGSSGAARRRFSREAQASAAVVHENVIEIHGVAEKDGLPYLVMPYVSGPSLQRRLDNEGPLELAEILRIGMQAATGLAAAHSQGLVHRDVKPANILLADGVERVKLTDFGLARAADDASLTKSGVIAGTPQYMSPEQARGETIDQRSDLFSLGSVLYAMCTGRTPFRAETPYGVLRRITDEEPRPIREINPEIPEWLCEIVDRLMSKDPDHRFQSAQEVAELLEQCLAHVQQPTVVSLPESLVVRPQASFFSSFRRPRMIAVFALMGVGLLAFLLWQTATPPDIAGEWQGHDWGEITLKETAPGQYTGIFSGAFHYLGKNPDSQFCKETCADCHTGGASGTIQLEWSLLQRRYKGTWGDGKKQLGKLSIRRDANGIRGAWTTNKKGRVSPATPEYADLRWNFNGYLPIAETELQVLGPNGRPVADNAVIRGSEGYTGAKLPSRFETPSDHGVISLGQLKPGTHWFLVNWSSILRLKLPAAEQKIVRTPPLPGRLRSRLVGKNLDAQCSVETTDDGEIIVIRIHNRDKEAVQIAETDLQLMPSITGQGCDARVFSPRWKSVADGKTLPATTIEPDGRATIRINWPDWVRRGFWFSRYGEILTEPALLGNEPGKTWVRVVPGGRPLVSVTHPDQLIAGKRNRVDNPGDDPSNTKADRATYEKLTMEYKRLIERRQYEDAELLALDARKLASDKDAQQLWELRSKFVNQLVKARDNSDEEQKLLELMDFSLQRIADARNAHTNSPPQPYEVIAAVEKLEKLPENSLNDLYKQHRDNIRIVVETVYDKVEEPRFYPLVGMARLHRVRFKCRLYFTESDELKWPGADKGKGKIEKRTYIDHDHLIAVEKNAGVTPPANGAWSFNTSDRNRGADFTPFDCVIVDSATGEPIPGNDFTIGLVFEIPKTEDRPWQLVEQVLLGSGHAGTFQFEVPEKVLKHPDRDLIQVRWFVMHPQWEQFGEYDPPRVNELTNNDPRTARDGLKRIALRATTPNLAQPDRFDEFTARLYILQHLGTQQTGRDPLRQKFEALLKQFPEHPDRAAAMYEIAALWSNDSEDREQFLCWLRKAVNASREGTPLWYKSRFWLQARLQRTDPDEADQILTEILNSKPDPVNEVKAWNQRVQLALSQNDEERAETICRQLHDRMASNENRPEFGYELGLYFQEIQSSARSLLNYWFHQTDVPREIREQKIKSFWRDYPFRHVTRYIDELTGLPDSQFSSLTIPEGVGVFGGPLRNLRWNETSQAARRARSVTPAQKGIARIELVFFQDKSRREIPAVMVPAGSQTLVVTAAPATIVPDGTPPAIDGAFLKLPGQKLMEARYLPQSTKELSVYSVDYELTDAYPITPTALKEGDRLVPLPLESINRLDFGPNKDAQIISLDANAKLDLKEPDIHHPYENLIELDKVLAEGTPVFKDGQLQGLTLLGSRFLGKAGKSYVVPVHRIAELSQQIPQPSADSSFFQLRPKLLTATQAVQRGAELHDNREKVTVRCQVDAVQRQTVTDEQGRTGGQWVLLLTETTRLTVRVSPAAESALLKQGIDIRRYFTGKVIELVGVIESNVQDVPGLPGDNWNMNLDSLDQLQDVDFDFVNYPQFPRMVPGEFTPAPRFSASQEVILAAGMRFMLDLDTGKTMDLPAAPRPEQAQMDVHPGWEFNSAKGVTGMSLKGLKVQPDDRNLSPSDLLFRIAREGRQPLVQMHYDEEETATYFFQTKEGTSGILELLALTDDPQGIRIRYKTVEVVSDPESDSNPSEQSPSGGKGAANPFAEPTESVNETRRSVLTATQAVQKGQELNNSREGVVVRFQVDAVKPRKLTNEEGRFEEQWELLLTETTKLTVRVSPQAEAELRKQGITDISQHFTGKIIELDGTVVGIGINDRARSSTTIWTYHMNLISPGQIRFIDPEKSPRPVTVQVDENLRFSESHELELAETLRLDLDTGQTMELSPKPTLGPLQADVCPVNGNLGTPPEGLRGFSLYGLKVNSNAWDATAGDLQQRLALDGQQPLEQMHYDADDPATYFFRTQSGTMGVLQIVSVDEKNPDSIRIRYKTLQPGSPAGPQGPEKTSAPNLNTASAASAAGSITIQGVVVDTNKTPIRGADVRLNQPLTHTEKLLAKGRTDETGRFRFPGISRDIKRKLVVSAPNYASIAGGANYYKTSDDVYECVLHKGESLKGRVLDPEGVPVAGAEVYSPLLKEFVPGVLSAKTDRNGFFEISDLRAWEATREEGDPVDEGADGESARLLRVFHPDYGIQLVRYRKVPSILSVRFEEPTIITGRVMHEVTFKPASGARVLGGNVIVQTNHKGEYRIAVQMQHLDGAIRLELLDENDQSLIEPITLHAPKDKSLDLGDLNLPPPGDSESKDSNPITRPGLLTPTEVIEKGEILSDSGTTITVRLQVGDVRPIQWTAPGGNTRKEWVLLPVTETDFFVRVSARAEAALKGKGVDDIPAYFRNKVIEVSGTVYLPVFNSKGPGLDYCMDVDALDQYYFVIAPDRPQTSSKHSVSTAQLVSRYQTTANVSAIALSPDGKRMAVANGHLTFELPPDPLREYQHNYRPIVEIMDTESGNNAVALQILTDEEAAIVNSKAEPPMGEPRKGLLVIQTDYYDVIVTALEFSPDGKLLAVGTRIGQVKLFDAETGELVRTLNNAQERLKDDEYPERWKKLARANKSVNALSFSPDGETLVVSGRAFASSLHTLHSIGGLQAPPVPLPGQLTTWEVATGAMQHNFVGHDYLNDVEFSPDGKFLASCGYWYQGRGQKQGVILWDARTGEMIRNTSMHENGADSIEFSPDSKFIALRVHHKQPGFKVTTGARYLLDVNTGDVAWRALEPPHSALIGFASDNSSVLIYLDYEKQSLKFFDTTSWKVIRQMEWKNPAVNFQRLTFAVSPDLNSVIVGGMDRELKGVVEVREFPAAVKQN